VANVGAEDHYFTSAPGSAARNHHVELETERGRVRLRSSDGTFSPRRIDPGTAVLLASLPDPGGWPDGPVLDLGCGYGPIAAAVSIRSPGRSVWGVEVNERAADDCRHNAAALSLDIRVAAPGEVPEDQRFAAIVSNPPVRIGKAALRALLSGWLPRLVDDGEAWLVVQRHLGADSLAAWLDDTGWRTERIRSRRGYRVLRVRR
jgi:16S rRNA G1207 methylase RsmC